MNRSNVKAYVSALNSAALNRRTALQTELAVSFAVVLESAPSRRLARAQLCEIYASAGYKCREPSDLDWKTINRRISAAFALFDFLDEGKGEVRTWAGDLTRGPLISALVERIAPLKLTTVNEINEICSAAKSGRKDPRGRKPGIRIETAHLHLTIPPTTTREELLEAATRLMQIANDMVGTPEDHPAAEFKKAA